jgi:Acetyltransferase (GNAT) domain
MTGVHDVTPAVRLRSVEDRDLDVFFDHQADPQAVEMAAFPARDKDQFAAHWAKVRADDTLVARTIVADGMVAGNIGSWQENGQQLLGYWVGRECWGRGVATQALALFVDEVSIRPLTPMSRCTTWARSASWTSVAFGAIACRRRRRMRPTTASRSSSSC